MPVSNNLKHDTNRNGTYFEFDTGVLSADKDNYLDYFTGPIGWTTGFYDKAVGGESHVFARAGADDTIYGSQNNNTKVFSLNFDDSVNGLDYTQTDLAGSLRGAGFDLGPELLNIRGVDFYNPINNNQPIPTPEPATALLVGLGLLGAAGYTIRKQKMGKGIEEKGANYFTEAKAKR